MNTNRKEKCGHRPTGLALAAGFLIALTGSPAIQAAMVSCGAGGTDREGKTIGDVNCLFEQITAAGKNTASGWTIIVLGPHTYQLTKPLPPVTTLVKIQGSGAGRTKVVGKRSGACVPFENTAEAPQCTLPEDNGQFRVFTVLKPGHLVLESMDVTGGHTWKGGGVYNNGTLWVIASRVYGNLAQSGGGIYQTGDNNAADDQLRIENSTIAGNVAYQEPHDIAHSGGGGGIYIDSGRVTITSSTINSNLSNLVEFGIYEPGDAMKLPERPKNDHRPPEGAVGAGIQNGRLRANESRFVLVPKGTVTSIGGNLKIYNTTISDNKVNISGRSRTDEQFGLSDPGNSNWRPHAAGIFNDATGTISLRNVTITSNHAFSMDSGFAVFNADGGSRIDLANSMISGNQEKGSPSCFGRLISFGGNTHSNGCSLAKPDPSGEWGWKSAWCAPLKAPCAPAPDQEREIGFPPPLQNNGGLTCTHALDIGKGWDNPWNSQSILPSRPHPGCFSQDQRGLLRDLTTRDGSGNIMRQGQGCDIGAFQAHTTGPSQQIQPGVGCICSTKTDINLATEDLAKTKRCETVVENLSK